MFFLGGAQYNEAQTGCEPITKKHQCEERDFSRLYLILTHASGYSNVASTTTHSPMGVCKIRECVCQGASVREASRRLFFPEPPPFAPGKSYFSRATSASPATFPTWPLRGYAIRPHEFQNNTPAYEIRASIFAEERSRRRVTTRGARARENQKQTEVETRGKFAE